MVIRKLASTLVAILKHPLTPWTKAIWQLAASLVHGQYVSEDLARGVGFKERILPELTREGSNALLIFSTVLAEDALRSDSEPQHGTGNTSALGRTLSNFEDALVLVQYVLTSMMQHVRTAGDHTIDVDLGIQAMDSWKVRF